jgi:serine/threonine-protein kinase
MTTFTDDAIRDQLEKIITSATFQGAHRAIRLLQFLVDQTLSGKASTLKEYTLGVDGLGRAPSFDPRTDSIVRVEASRLRNRLELYYAKDGAFDAIQIALPRGGYAPRFEPCPIAAERPANPDDKTAGASHFPPNGAFSNPRSRLRVAVAVLALSAMVFALILYSRPNPETYSQSLAVLPFSSEEQTISLADGLTENLINNLSRLSNLRVIARSTAFKFRGKEGDPIQVGKDLNAGTVVSGRFALLHDDNFTMQVEMVNAASGAQIWGDQYAGKLAEIPSVQERIGTQIAAHLRLNLSREDQRQLTRRYTNNPEVYPLYWQGLFLASKPTKIGIQKAIDYYKQAIAKDANFAPAYVSLATCYTLQSAQAGPETLLKEAKAAVMRAIEIDDTLAEAHAELGFLKWIHDLDEAGAEKELQLALKLNSNSAVAHFDYSRVLAENRRFDEALVEAHRAIELDHLSIQTRKRLPYVLFLAGRYNEASLAYQDLNELAGDFIQAQRELGLVYEQQGRTDLALRQFEKVAAMPENYAGTMSRADIGHVYAISGHQKEAESVLKTLLQEYDQDYVSAYDIAVIYAGLNDAEEAFRWLRTAVDQRPFFIGWLKVDPRLDQLRKDKRFGEVLRRARLSS